MKSPLLFLSAVFIWLCTACSPYPHDVQEALSSARHNSDELKKVLNYYKGKDSQKYKAACFLIANMPYHESREEVLLPTGYNDYFTITDSLYDLYFGRMSAKQIKQYAFKIPDSIRNFLSAKYRSLPQPIYSKGKKDIESVTADFLIDNIETAFNLWHTSPLLKNMPFDEFKESVLPYRTTDEPLLYRKSELKKKKINSILNIYNDKDESIFLLDFPFIKDGENYKKSFLIQPGELVVCSYNIHNLAKSVFEKRLNVKRMQLQVWLKYGTRGAKELERVYFTKEFDY